MRIDCDTCTARRSACCDCVVSAFLSIRPPMPQLGTQLGVPVVLDDSERAAVDALCAAGLLPPLRLVARLGAEFAGHVEGVA